MELTMLHFFFVLAPPQARKLPVPRGVDVLLVEQELLKSTLSAQTVVEQVRELSDYMGGGGGSICGGRGSLYGRYVFQ